jgi:hypothetical protein
MLKSLLLLCLFSLSLKTPLLAENAALPAEAPPGTPAPDTPERISGPERSNGRLAREVSEVREKVTDQMMVPEAEGKVIRSIEIRVTDVFEDPDLAIYRTANSIKVNTQQEVIRQELLIKEGGEFSNFAARESERRLRDLKYLRKISVVPTVDGDFVDVMVAVQDVWTLLPQFSFNSTAGRQRMAGALIETNFLGLGKRIEVGYETEEEREILQTVYDDNHLFGTSLRFVGALFQRSDGHEGLIYLGKPLRSLLDTEGWFISSRISDTVGRLFEDGDEEYIFRQNNDEVQGRYTWASGDPEFELDRYSLGYTYQRDFFDVAGLDDYEDLDLDPSEVSNDPSRLPSNRTFSGPVLAWEHIEPRFISMNYIDRFERVEDYNLGSRYDVNLTYAAEVLGSRDDAILLSLNRSRGYQFSPGAFIRGEVGLATRYEDGDFRNSLSRIELKYFNVLGDFSIGDTFLGKHTLAVSYFLDYGARLDGDRQFTVGGDNALRGYKARAFVGDKRMVLNVEDRVHLFDDLFKLISVGGAAFLDVGGATYDGLESIITEDLYGDVGIGLRLGFPRSTGGGVVRLDLALPFREGDDGTNGFEIRLVFGAGQLFNSRVRSETLGPERANIDIGVDR